MDLTNEIKLEVIKKMCNDWKVDLEMFYYISVGTSQVTLQMKYDSDFVRDLTKLGVEWTLEKDYGFTIGTAKYEGVYFRFSLT